MEEMEAIVSGRVQLVMYRDFVQRKARLLGIFGFVRNNPDGTVTVLAQGEREKLGKFEQYLRRGSVLSSVKNVDVKFRNIEKLRNNFGIEY